MGKTNVAQWEEFKKNKQAFTATSMSGSMDPTKITMRQSGRDFTHKNSTPVIGIFDQTGSMGDVPKYQVTKGLGQIYTAMDEQHTALPDLQFMFGAVGDSKPDHGPESSPLQVGNFHFDAQSCADLQAIYLEGAGGGQQKESYHLAWYFAATKCDLSSWRQNKKGILFTVGDEWVHETLTADEIRRVIDTTYRGADLRNQAILALLKDKFLVYHLALKYNSYYCAIDQWEALLGKEYVIRVDDYTKIADTILNKVLPHAADQNRLHITTPHPVAVLPTPVNSVNFVNSVPAVKFSLSLQKSINEQIEILQKRYNSIHKPDHLEQKIHVATMLQANNFQHTPNSLQRIFDYYPGQPWAICSWRNSQTETKKIFDRAVEEVQGPELSASYRPGR